MIRPPAGDADSSWSALLPPPPPPRPLAGELQVGSAVIGAGLTGLAIARRLAELRPGEPVAVVEAQRVGAGASGRNAGFVVDLTDFAAQMSPADRDRYVRVARFGIQCLAELVSRHAIECDWDDRGYLRAAAGEEGLRALDRWPAWLDAVGTPYRHLDAGAAAAFTGTAFYRAAIHLPGSINLQPAALVRGLARSLPHEVTVYETSPVRRIRRQDRRHGAFRVQAGAGALLCQRLFLAANGYTPGLGFLRHRASPRWSFGSLTRTLTAAEQAALGGEPHWGVLPADPGGSTVRRTRDQRILIRNTFHYTAASAVPSAVRGAAGVRHRQAFAARFPGLAEVPFEHTWSGLYGASRNGQAYFGELAPGLFTAAVYNFAGIAMGTAAGRLLADLATGAESPRLADLRQLPPPSWLPPEPLRSWDGRRSVARQNRQAGAHL
ncbi:MAG TPA: FAD-binding oxidoreductase [Thermoanaerobaculia bacterium]|nr:FAD-binding oxidoreductase [Thermoanaerobaculia bacterium]